MELKQLVGDKDFLKMSDRQKIDKFRETKVQINKKS